MPRRRSSGAASLRRAPDRRATLAPLRPAAVAQHLPRAKIVCTLGPSTSTPEIVSALIEDGMNVARINFSHGTREEQAERIALVRRLAAKSSVPVAVLGDLQGPRIRIGELADPIVVEAGQDVVLCFEELAAPGEIPVTYDSLATVLNVGDRILIDDALIELVEIEEAPPRVRARVVYGGPIRSHKGINLPGVSVS